MHQGDLGKLKGVYYINTVDEVTQWEFVICVSHITDEFMIPSLEHIIESLPFKIINFHSDNGGEYINYKVSEILKRLTIKQTKSRSRKSTDNALVEGKNGFIIRKTMGRNFIHKDNVELINEYYKEYHNRYLNFHRVCSFATDYTDKRGKIRKKYDVHTTPYERLKSLPDASSYLKKEVTFEALEIIATEYSDNEWKEKIDCAKIEMLKKIDQKLTEE